MSIGNLETIGDKQVITGSSGIRAKDLIEVDTAPLQKKIDTSTKDVEKLDEKIVAFSEFTLLLTNLKKAADALRNPFSPMNSSAEANAFKARQTILLSSDPVNSPPLNYASAVAHDGATPTKHTLQINNVATSMSEIYTGFTSNTADVTNGGAGGVGLFSAGTFEINGYSITVDPGDSLSTIASRINALNKSTGVSATIQQTSNKNFTLKISSDATGIANAFSVSDAADNVLGNLNFDRINSTQAQDANFVFNGQVTTRSLNTITDLFPNQEFTLSLYNNSPPGVTITIEVAENPKATITAIETFMAEYNKVMVFAYKQTERDPKKGTYKDTAILGKESEFYTTVLRLVSIVSGRASGLSANAMASLSELGITVTKSDGNLSDKEKTPAKNILAFVNDNSAKLDTAISQNLFGVASIFEFKYISSSNDLVVTKSSNATTASSFTLDIDRSRENVNINGNSIQDKVRVIVDGVIYRPNFKGKTIEGQKGSPIEGLKMFYQGTGPETIKVDLSQGIADKMYNFLDDQVRSVPSSVDDLLDGKQQFDKDGNVLKKGNKDLKDDKGTMFMAVKKIMGQQKLIQDNIEKHQKKLEEQREKLLKSHSRNEGLIAKSNNTRDALNNQFKAMWADK